MFRSARLKLTLFYLGTIVLFNLTVTLSIRVYAEHEFVRSNIAQRSEVRRWALHLFDTPMPKRSTTAINNFQDQQVQIVRDHLNQSLLVINLLAMAIGGMLSYWFAGRTLKPIEDAHEAQERFTTDASHELRTPLANMRLENEVFLRQKHFTEAEGREQIESNLEEVQRLERLANNLLALHQFGRTALTRQPVSVPDIVAAAVAQIKSTASAKHVTIKQEIAPAKVLAHKESVAQLMDILLDNALKYGAGGGEITITGRLQRRSNRYLLSVQDRGPGLAEQDVPRVFDRLFRGDKARSTKVAGYGLGLALAKEIADANSAGITARNNPGGGACFEIALETVA